MNLSINQFSTKFTIRNFSGNTEYDADTQEPTESFEDVTVRGDIQSASPFRIQNSGGLLNNDSKQIVVAYDTTVNLNDWVILSTGTFQVQQITENSNRKIIFVNKYVQ